MARAQLARGLAVAMLIGGSLGISSCIEDEGMFYAFGLAGGDAGDNCDDQFSSAAVVQSLFVADRNNAVVIQNGAAVCLQNKIKSNRLNGVETSNIIIYEYEISFSDGSSRTQAIGGSVEADGADGSSGLDGGILVMGISLFDADGLTSHVEQALNSPNGQIETVAGIIVRGRTTGGLEVETPEFFFPIEIFANDRCFCESDAENFPACPDAPAFDVLCN
jgi:hypothetical protein